MKVKIGWFFILLISLCGCQDKPAAQADEATKVQSAAEKAPVSKSVRACKNLLKLSNSETFGIPRCEADLVKKMEDRCKSPADFEKYYDCMIAAKTLEDAICNDACPPASAPSAPPAGAAEPAQPGTKAP